ncbi:hypothetical protein DPEC_G00063000 [Dallia pectoralis]|uniref:Uncharacterized protein n=1 Tax=Dallia pectoralis TaxID=75939 RepID=A0ACC2H887_DALPE|nr:hypothetical protein DPEC_G00063000 [Dallia pectoralis]
MVKERHGLRQHRLFRAASNSLPTARGGHEKWQAAGPTSGPLPEQRRLIICQRGQRRSHSGKRVFCQHLERLCNSNPQLIAAPRSSRSISRVFEYVGRAEPLDD